MSKEPAVSRLNSPNDSIQILTLDESLTIRELCFGTGPLELRDREAGFGPPPRCSGASSTLSLVPIITDYFGIVHLPYSSRFVGLYNLGHCAYSTLVISLWPTILTYDSWIVESHMDLCHAVNFFFKLALGIGFSVLKFGYWILGVGYWWLGTGHWALGIRYWARGIEYCQWISGNGPNAWPTLSHLPQIGDTDWIYFKFNN